VNETFLAIINPAAGGGRCGERVGKALDRLRTSGIALETARTSAAGEATKIARDAYNRGYRKFLAVGGDGTSYEIVNGLFTRNEPQGVSNDESQIPTLGFLPLGTGNSFLRDFVEGTSGEHQDGLEHAMRALETRRSRPCDVLRLTHRDGVIHYIGGFKAWDNSGICCLFFSVWRVSSGGRFRCGSTISASSIRAPACF
jgi:diacylglycerol kinase family enzyme